MFVEAAIVLAYCPCCLQIAPPPAAPADLRRPARAGLELRAVRRAAGRGRRMERLRTVHQALEPRPAALQAAAPPIEPLRQHDDGSVVGEDLELLGRHERTAAEARDYRTAGILRDTLEALRPQQQLSIEDCSPTDVGEQHAFFLKHGFILLHDILPKEKIPRAQAAWTAAQERAEAVWQAKKAAGPDGGLDQSQLLYYDLPNLLAEDDVFIDMIDSPALVPILSRITGSPDALDPQSSLRAAGYTGCMRCGAMGGRVVPTETDTDGYTRWHLDQPLPDDAANPNYRTVKVFVGIFDLPPNGGATAVVPGTHRIPSGPGQVFERGNFRCSGQVNHRPEALHQTRMPNYVEAALPAGCGIAFDSHIWHTSMPNTSGIDRRCAYFGYRSSGRFWPELPSWGPVAGLSEETLKRLDVEGKLGVVRRRILGLPDAGTGGDEEGGEQ